MSPRSQPAASPADAARVPCVWQVPDSYVPKRGPNKWKSGRAAEVEELLKRFDSDRDYIISVNELHALLSRASPTLTFKECGRIYDGARLRLSPCTRLRSASLPRCC